MNKIYFIVESPNKIKKIKQILNELSTTSNIGTFEIYATMGHFRDLTTNKEHHIGIKFDYGKVNGIFEYSERKNYFITKLKSFQKFSNCTFYLATDPDREGEAIAWHIIDVLGVNKHHYYRIQYQSITKDDIKRAIENKSAINMNLVYSQLSRRYIDRIVGWCISPLVQKNCKVASAGRVQSIVIKMILERNLEIEYFVKKKYYHIYGIFDKYLDKKFKYISNQEMNSSDIKSIHQLLNNTIHLQNKYEYTISKNQEYIYPKQPYITSTIQKDCYNKYKWNVQKTMFHLQTLFENGFITYHRTDSFMINDKELNTIRKYIITNYGQEYSFKKTYKNKQNSQEAHECIRPTNIFCNTFNEEISNDDNNNCLKQLYQDIWIRTIQSQMIAGIDNITNEYCIYHQEEQKFEFKYTTREIETYGFRAFKDTGEIMLLNKENSNLCSNQYVQYCNLKELIVEEYETKPPSRYTQSSLIEQMEKEGIGRPSTYAYIIQKICSMNLFNTNFDCIDIEKCECYVNYLNDKFCDTFMDINYTKKMENDLDQIANGDIEWNNYVITFYKKLLEYI